MFTNGQTGAIWQVALARFIAPTELAKMGRNLYAESFDSGQPIVGMANTSSLGNVLSNSLELSNVDLAEQFVKMISSQRGFEANSKIITTTDQLLQLLVNLKQKDEAIAVMKGRRSHDHRPFLSAEIGMRKRSVVLRRDKSLNRQATGLLIFRISFSGPSRPGDYRAHYAYVLQPFFWKF